MVRRADALARIFDELDHTWVWRALADSCLRVIGEDTQIIERQLVVTPFLLVLLDDELG